MNFIFNQQNKKHDKEFRCLCELGCVAKDAAEQNHREIEFMVKPNFGECMPIFCPFFEKTIFKHAEDEINRSENKNLVYDKETSTYSWKTDSVNTERYAIRKALLEKRDSFTPIPNIFIHIR